MSEERNSATLKKVKKFIGAFSLLVIAIIIGIYFSTGIYQLNPSEVGLVKRFGKYIRTDEPGINYHFPAPFDSVTVVDIRTVRKIEIGFRAISPGRFTTITKEALMMTGDNNFASVESVVQFRISDPYKYAFGIQNPEEIVRFVCESVIRERVAQRDIDQVLTSDRDSIAMEAKKRIQETLDKIGTGVFIDNVKLQEVYPPESVIAAFDDVNAAIQDKEKIVNTALKYYNDVVPRAEGEASKTLQEAQAYQEIEILKAEGGVARFNQILIKYLLSPDITKERLYIETMERILPGQKKILLLEDQGTLNFLDIEQVLKEGVVK